jgi:hypothetical protein
MAGNYAIKSIVIIDFIDVTDIAGARPFRRTSECALTPSQPLTYDHVAKVLQRQDVHFIAASKGDFVDTRAARCKIYSGDPGPMRKT